MESTANGIITVLTPASISWYGAKQVQEALGVSRDKAYRIIRALRGELIESGRLTPAYPVGKVPKKYFESRCLIE